MIDTSLPWHPCVRATAGGSVRLPVTWNRNGARVSRAGLSFKVRRRALKRRTVTAWIALEAWSAVSTARAISVSRPTSPPRGAYSHVYGAIVSSHTRRSSSRNWTFATPRSSAAPAVSVVGLSAEIEVPAAGAVQVTTRGGAAGPPAEGPRGGGSPAGGGPAGRGGLAGGRPPVGRPPA